MVVCEKSAVRRYEIGDRSIDTRKYFELVTLLRKFSPREYRNVLREVSYFWKKEALYSLKIVGFRSGTQPKNFD